MRVAMLALRNLLTNDKLELGPEMVEAGLPKVVQQRISQVGCCPEPYKNTETGCFADFPCLFLVDVFVTL